MSDPRAPFHRIAIGTDHGGYEMKNRLVTFLESQGHPVIDCGTYNGDPADYPIYAGRVARAVSSGLADAGVLLCKSGNGVAMVANRYPGVRAGWAEDEKGAALTREHNNANALVIGSEHLRGDLLETVRAWLNARHEPTSRHGRRVAMIDELDQVHVSALPPLRLIQATASPWLASVPIGLADSGDFPSFIKRQHLRGATVGRAPLAQEVTINPDRWRAAIRQWDRERLDTAAVAQALYIGYVRMVARALEPTFTLSDGDEGMVAVRVPVTLDATAGQIVEHVQHTAGTLERPNAFLSIPALPAAMKALSSLAESGHSILLRGVVSPEALDRALYAWFGGLEARVKSGQPIHAQRLVLSVPAVMLRWNCRLEGLSSAASNLLAMMNRHAKGTRYHDLALTGAALPRIAWDCEGARGTEIELAAALFSPLTIQIHDTAFFEVLEGALDSAEHPLRDWLSQPPSEHMDSSAEIETLQDKAPAELCQRENKAGDELVAAIKTALRN